MNELDLTELKRQTLELFDGDQNAATKWLNEELPILGNKSPLECAKSAEGIEEVLMLIGRIQHGVFS